MKYIVIVALSLLCGQAQAADVTAQQMLSLVHQVNELQNKAMLTTSVAADVDALFALYSADFEYVHAEQGGIYSRELLYNNIVRAIKNKRFQDNKPRYQIEAILPGKNAVAVKRWQQTGTAAYHLAIFGFADGKVKRIVEYW